MLAAEHHRWQGGGSARPLPFIGVAQQSDRWNLGTGGGVGCYGAVPRGLVDR
jgi:hypothetical protein